MGSVIVRDFKLALLLVVLTTTLVACGNSDNDEGGTDSQTPPGNDELTSVLDVFSIDGVKVPFMEVQENSEGELSPQTAGYFEDGQYIVDGLRDNDMDDFETMSTDEITSEIDSIVSEIDRPVNASDTVSMDYVVEPYYETLHVFKRESETDGSTSLQIPIFFTMPNVVTGNVPADMDEAQLDSFIRTERENRFLTGEPINSVDIKLNARGPIVKSNSDTGKPYEGCVGYLTAFSINDSVQCLEETTRSER